MLENIKDRFLSNNKTDIHMDKISELEKEIKELKEKNKKLDSINNDLKKYKKETNKILDSYNSQFSTLFLYYNLEVKGLLKYNQELNQELLDFTVNICNKYNLDYWLDFGLMLGAVRHKGFIPWDDDLDIGMIRKDYDKFLEVIEHELKENDLEGTLKISLNVNKYKPLPILQLLYYEGGSILAGIDIFPYDFIEDTSNFNVKTYKKIQKSVIQKNRDGATISSALKEFNDYYNLDYEEKNYIIPGVEGCRGLFPSYKFVIFETKNIYPLKNMIFEGKEYKVPNNTDDYLTKTYGNYMSIPKIIHHHHNRFESLYKRKNANKIYENHINKMKKINEKYK